MLPMLRGLATRIRVGSRWAGRVVDMPPTSDSTIPTVVVDETISDEVVDDTVSDEVVDEILTAIG